MWLLVTVAVFFSARLICQRVNSPLMNPLLFSLFILIPTLIFFGVPYEQYYSDNKWINDLLQPAVVALAYPLYEQLPQIRRNWRTIMLACSVGSTFSLLSAGLIAISLNTDLSLIASLLGKSVTTPIAMEISKHLGGEPSIAAIMVLIVGLFGAIMAYPIYGWLNISHPIAKGLTMGTVSHALGTATCAERSCEDAAFSSLALVICGVITSILAPQVFSILILLSR